MKTEWTSPKLEILSTRKTAAGGSLPFDSFHTRDSNSDTQPSQYYSGS